MELTPQLNQALAKAKTEFPKILENKKVKIPTKSGREISFAYAELEEIAEAVTPSLSGFGLTIVSQLAFVEDKFCLVTTLRHESGEAIASHFPLPFDPTSDPKDLGTKISYGRRYNTICLLEITTIEPSSAQRDEQVRKLARDINRENTGKPEPIRKGDSSFLESFEPVPKPANGQSEHPNITRIREVRSLFGIDKQVVADYLKSAMVVNNPISLSQEQVNFVVLWMAAEWGKTVGISQQQVESSFRSNIPSLISQGRSEVEAIQMWMDYVKQQFAREK